MPRLTALLLLSLMTWTATAGALMLTDEERRWLKDHPDLRLGVDASWPPFEFRDDQGRYQGLAADYVEIIRERLAVTLTPIEPASWTAVLESVAQGKIDLLPGIMSTPERQNFLAFTRPYLDFPIVILAHRGGAQPHNLKDLYGLKIAVVENYAPHELLRNHHPDLNLVALPNVSSTLQALATDKVDAVVGDLASSVWSLRQLKLEGLYVSGETPYRYQLAMAVPRDNKILVGILDKVIADMNPAEIAEIQEKWVGNVRDYREFWSDLLLYGLPGLLLLMGILAVVIRINRRLSSEIARRVDLEQELRSSEYHYRGLVESLSAIAWEAKVSDFTYTYVSPHAEDLLGYPLAHWLIPGFWRNIIHPADLIRAQTYCDHEVLAGRDHSIDYRVITADGRCLWVRDIVSLIEHGHEPVMRGLMIDISEAKRTEEALRLSEQKFASVFRQCPDILVIARLLDGRHDGTRIRRHDGKALGARGNQVFDGRDLAVIVAVELAGKSAQFDAQLISLGLRAFTHLDEEGIAFRLGDQPDNGLLRHGRSAHQPQHHGPCGRDFDKPTHNVSSRELPSPCWARRVESRCGALLGPPVFPRHISRQFHRCQ